MNKRNSVNQANKVNLINILLLALSFILCLIFYPDRANSGSGPYTNSAHGNTTYGVNRTGLSAFGYSKGNCAHCHEQHTSIGGAEPAPVDGVPSRYELFRSLFGSQSAIFCYSCHKTAGSLQDPPGPMSQQYNYSRMAGGDTTITCPFTIRMAFQFVDGSGNPQLNCDSRHGSAHFLDDIRNFLRNQNWGFDTNINNIDPCSGCHNPHRAQKDPHGDNPGGRIGADGKLAISSISLPSRHSKDNNAWGLWGEESGERMSDKAASVSATYQAPCQYPYPSSPPYICTKYEPDGSATTDGSNLFDSVTFCVDCHQYQITGTVRTVQAINWSANGDIHGAAAPQTCCDKGDKKPPYTDGINYVLSCLDCHEPHGSPNEFLLRQEVNGTRVPNLGTHLYYNFCLSCHTNLSTKHIGGIPIPGTSTDCWGCHRHGFYNYPEPLNCSACPGSYIKTF